VHQLDNIPENELPKVLRDIEREGLFIVSKFKASNGTWTIIVSATATAGPVTEDDLDERDDLLEEDELQDDDTEEEGPLQGASEVGLVLRANEVFRDAILTASDRTGIDAAALAALINAEAAKNSDGSWNPSSAAPTSSAVGLTQFIDTTWEFMAKRSGTLLNETARDKGFVTSSNKIVASRRKNLLALRLDPTQSIVAAAEYGNRNLASLHKDALVPQGANDDDIARLMYLAHHEGLAGAKAFLRGTLTAARATKLLAANVPNANRRSALLARNGGSSVKAYREWLESYIKERVVPNSFRAEVEPIAGPATPTDDTSAPESAGAIPDTGDDDADFAAFIASLQLKHFKPHEFLKMGAQNGNPDSPAFGLNTFPPRHLWPNIAPTAMVLDMLREEFDAPVLTVSIYRSPAYNEKIGGAKHSQHKRFCAVDFVVAGSSSRPTEWAEALKVLRAQGRFKGGIGVYTGFVHIDTRGEDADWTG